MSQPAENSEPSSGEQRVIGRPFQPGQSGNPGGRPKGIAKRAREMTDDGNLLLRFWVNGVLGRVMNVQTGELTTLGLTAADLSHRRECARQLADRGWGKAIEHLEHTGADGGPIELGVMRNPDEQRLLELLRVMREIEGTDVVDGEAEDAEIIHLPEIEIGVAE